MLRRFSVLVLVITGVSAAPLPLEAVDDSVALQEKAGYVQHDSIDQHRLDGLSVSIVPAAPPGTKLPQTVNEPGNV